MNTLDAVTRGYIAKRPDAAAQTLMRLNDGSIRELLEVMPRNLAARVLENMAPGSASHCLQLLPHATVAEIVTQMPMLKSVAPLRLMQREHINELLKLVPQTTAAHLRLRLRYADTVIGAYIDSDVVTFNPEHRVGDAMRLFRREGQRTGNSVHVVDDSRHVVGLVHLNDLLVARDNSMVAGIMLPAATLLHARSALQTVVGDPAWLSHDNLPVVNRNDEFQGVLRRSRVVGETRQLINGITAQNEADATRIALADIFWITTGALFARPEPDTNEPGKDR